MHRLEVAVNLAVLARLKAAGFDKLRPSHVAFVDQMGDGCRMSVLAKRLNLTPGAVTQLAAQMEELGYVARVMDPDDRRAVIVRPSARVAAVWTTAREAVDAVEARWKKQVGSRRYAELRATIADLATSEETSATY